MDAAFRELFLLRPKPPTGFQDLQQRYLEQEEELRQTHRLVQYREQLEDALDGAISFHEQLLERLDQEEAAFEILQEELDELESYLVSLQDNETVEAVLREREALRLEREETHKRLARCRGKTDALLGEVALHEDKVAKMQEALEVIRAMLLGRVSPEPLVVAPLEEMKAMHRMLDEVTRRNEELQRKLKQSDKAAAEQERRHGEQIELAFRREKLLNQSLEEAREREDQTQGELWRLLEAHRAAQDDLEAYDELSPIQEEELKEEKRKVAELEEQLAAAKANASAAAALKVLD